LPGCFHPLPQQAYFTSPLNGYANDYHPLPLLKDSAHTALYVSGNFLTGVANVRARDEVNAFRGAFTVAHHGAFFQAYYGGGLTLGSYNMKKWDSGYTSTPYWQAPPPEYDANILNSHAGPKFFGAASFHAGFNLVIAGGDVEWRAIGLETTLNHEFGSYLSVRKGLPDTAATLIARRPFYGTFGVSSELIISGAHGELGARIAGGPVFGDPYSDPKIYDNASRSDLRYWYLTMTSHYTQGRYTGYTQLNLAAKAVSFSLGLHYRLTRPRVREPRRPHRRAALYRN
jgi:hypothetical protein